MKNFTVVCFKSLVMDTGETAFIRGKSYTLEGVGTFIKTTNEQGHTHYFDDYGDDDFHNWLDVLGETES